MYIKWVYIEVKSLPGVVWRWLCQMCVWKLATECSWQMKSRCTPDEQYDIFSDKELGYTRWTLLGMKRWYRIVWWTKNPGYSRWTHVTSFQDEESRLRFTNTTEGYSRKCNFWDRWKSWLQSCVVIKRCQAFSPSLVIRKFLAQQEKNIIFNMLVLVLWPNRKHCQLNIVIHETEFYLWTKLILCI